VCQLAFVQFPNKTAEISTVIAARPEKVALFPTYTAPVQTNIAPVTTIIAAVTTIIAAVTTIIAPVQTIIALIPTGSDDGKSRRYRRWFSTPGYRSHDEQLFHGPDCLLR
jgi:hypothetical protein